MGRRKIEIQPITNERNRSVTFLKRKNGLFKKAHELGVLCSVDVAVIIFDERQGHDTKLFQYCSSDVRDILSRHMRHTGERDTRGPADFSDGAAGAKMGGAADVDEEDEEGEAEDVAPPPPARASRGSARDKTDEEFRPSARVIAEPSTKQRPSMSQDRSRSTVSLPSYPPVPPSQLPVSSDRMHQHQRPYDDVPHTNKRPRLDSSHDSYGLGLSTTHLSRPGHLPLSSASSEESVSISMHHRNRNIGPGVGAADDSGYMYHPAHQQFRGPGSGLQRMSSDPSHHQSHSPQYPPPYSASSYSGTPPPPHGPPHSYASSYSDFPMPWANGGGGGGGGSSGSGGGGRSQSQHQHSAPSSATSMATFFPPAPGAGGGYPDPTAFPRGDDAKSSFASAFLEAEQHRRTAHHGSRSGHAQSAAAFGLDWPEHVRPQPSPAPAPAQAQQQQQSSQRRQRGEEQQEARESASKADGSGAEESTVAAMGAGDGDGDGAGEEGENDSPGQGEQQNEVGWLELLGGGAPPAAETRAEAALVGGA